MSYIQKSVPFHLQVYEIIREKILSGELKGGERIYENKISQELGVSRSPVREALRMLEQDEFLVFNSPSGLIVNPMNFQDMEEIYQCRMAVEPFAAKLALESIHEEDISALKQCVKEAKEYHNKKLFNKVIEVNTPFS
ncbi:MAG: GntR family transcriptional regulator [Desulfitobacteriia bacterium]